MLSAVAAAVWGGWNRVDRELTTASWLDSLFDGRGRELLARAALARGADSIARMHAERAVNESRSERSRIREILLARALIVRRWATAQQPCTPSRDACHP
jgi:hypothetical protein